MHLDWSGHDSQRTVPKDFFLHRTVGVYQRMDLSAPDRTSMKIPFAVKMNTEQSNFNEYKEETWQFAVDIENI